MSTFSRVHPERYSSCLGVLPVTKTILIKFLSQKYTDNKFITERVCVLLWYHNVTSRPNRLEN